MKYSTAQSLKAFLILSILLFDVVASVQLKPKLKNRLDETKNKIVRQFFTTDSPNGPLIIVAVSLMAAGLLGASAGWTERAALAANLDDERKKIDKNVVVAERACAAVRDMGNVQTPGVNQYGLACSNCQSPPEPATTFYPGDYANGLKTMIVDIVDKAKTYAPACKLT